MLMQGNGMKWKEWSFRSQKNNDSDTCEAHTSPNPSIPASELSITIMVVFFTSVPGLTELNCRKGPCMLRTTLSLVHTNNGIMIS